MKIIHYQKQNRDLNGTFAKKKMKTGLKLFIADFITIAVMATLISMQLTGRLAPEGPVVASNSTLNSSSAIALNQAKQDVLQSQIDLLNGKMQTLRKDEMKSGSLTSPSKPLR